MNATRLKIAALAVAAAFAAPAAAELSAADLAKLGTTLTPLGGEKAGNAAGTIPAWDGGITAPVAGLQAGRPLPRSVRRRQAAFTITGANADQYKAQLSPTAQWRCSRSTPTYKMVVYPTRRTASSPACHYKETKECAAKAQARPRRQRRRRAAAAACPSRSRRTATRRSGTRCCATPATRSRMNWSQAAVTRGGDYALVKFEYEYDFSYGNLSSPGAARGQHW